jgi:hypothetical protein
MQSEKGVEGIIGSCVWTRREENEPGQRVAVLLVHPSWAQVASIVQIQYSSSRYVGLAEVKTLMVANRKAIAKMVLCGRN